MTNSRFPRRFGRPSLILRFLIALCFSVLGVLPCATQQTNPDLAEASLEELGNLKVYAASKHVQSGADAPASVTVITSDEIEKHGYRTLADVLQTVRGFYVTNDRNYTSLGVRGFERPGDYNTRILLLVDGHRLNDNVYDEAMLGREFPVDIDLIDRIEIVRGPVSSLYGSNALFAVVNVITKRGQNLSGFEAAGEAGSLNTYAGRMSYGKQFHQLEFLLSGTFYGSRGHNQLFFPFFNTPETNYGIASHADDEQVESALATVSFRDFTLQGVYGTREKGIPTGAYDTLFNNPGTRTADTHDYIDLRFDHAFAESWDVVARLFYDKYAYHGTYMYASPLNPDQADPNQDFGDGDWWGGELQLSKRLFHRHRITVGGEYRDNLHQNQDSYDTNPYLLHLDSDRHSLVAATYLQDEFTVTKSLTLYGGFRYDYYSDLDQASIDPRVALVYRPWSQTVFKYIYGQAFRVPSVYEMYYSIPPNLANPHLQPEKIRSNEWVWEQGLRNKVWLSTSVFYNLVDDLITDVPTTNQEQIFQNIQNVSSTGIEEEIRGQVSSGLEGCLSYSFQQTKDRQSGQFLSNSPRHLAKLRLTQGLLNRRLFLSLDSQYVSGIQSLQGGAVSPFAVVNGTVLGRNLGKHLDLSASIYNLLDKHYYDPPSSENLQMPIQQDGRNFRIKLTWHPGER